MTENQILSKTHKTVSYETARDLYNTNKVRETLKARKLQLLDFRVPKPGEKFLDYDAESVYEVDDIDDVGNQPHLIVKRVGRIVTKVPPKITVTISVEEIYGHIPIIPFEYEYAAFRIPEDGEAYIALDGKVVSKSDVYVAKCPRVIVAETFF